MLKTTRSRVLVGALIVAALVGATPMAASAVTGDKHLGGNNINNDEIATNQCSAVSIVTVAEGQPGQNATIDAVLNNVPKGKDACASAVSVMYVNSKGVLYQTPFFKAVGKNSTAAGAYGKRCQTITMVRRLDGSYFTYRENRETTLAACSGTVHHE